MESRRRCHTASEKVDGHPTRLIDVSGADMATIRVCNWDSVFEMGIQPNYLALSHCWGSGISVCLTEHNYSTFYTGTPIVSLPQTFQDAIHVTRGLSFSYLWIDSLCIMQNDEKHPEHTKWRADWYRESLLMRDVYALAALVIIAVASWNGLESFFVEQTPLAMHPCLVDVKKSSKGFGPEFGVYAWPSKRFEDKAAEDIAYSKIGSRGWCFQEEHLAKKIVWFGPNQIFFTCKSHPETSSTVSQVGTYPWHIQRSRGRQIRKTVCPV
jgi:hypothetical protein